MPDPTQDGLTDTSVGALGNLVEAQTDRALAGLIAETVREGLLVLGLDLRVRAANEAFCRTFRAAPDAYVGRPIYEGAGGLWDFPALHDLLESRLPRDGAIDDFEIDREFGEIGRRILLLRARRVPADALILLAIQDVTEHRLGTREQERIERALFNTQSIFQLLLDHIPQGVFWKDREGRFRGVNAVAARNTGLPEPGAAIGLTDYDLPGVTEEQAAFFQAMDREVMERGEPILGIEEPLGRPDGSTAWLRTNKVPLRDVDGRVIGVLGTWEDITEQRQAEQALRESEERFRTLADNVAQLVWMADADGWIFWYNKRWFDYTGTTLAEMEGWGWRRVHHPDHVDRVVAKITRCFETGEPWEDTFPLQGVDGTYRWFLSRALPVRDETGAVVRWFGTNTDVTERLELERSLYDLNEKLEDLVDERTRQVCDQEERVRELSRALTLAEQQERQRVAYILHDDLQQVLFAAKMALPSGDLDQIRSVLDEALALTRSLSHELSPPLLKSDDLRELLVWLADKKLERHGLDVEVDIRGGVSVPRADLRILLYQLLRELLLNVVKHAGTTRATIVAEPDDGYVLVTVADEGSGFEPDVLDAADAGMGLPSVRERLELVGGRLEVRSSPEAGSRITIAIPVRDDDPGPE